MAVLIAGGLGYIGSNITKKLLENNEEVIILDNLSNSNLGKGKLIKTLTNKTFKLYAKDLLNEKDIIQVFKENQIESVIYLAESQAKDVLKYYNETITMFMNMINSMKTFNCKRLIMTSVDIYENDSMVNETDPTINILSDRRTIKVKAKKIIESMLSDFYKENSKDNWSINILRLFNISGSDSSGMLGDINLKDNDIFTKLMKYELNKEPIVYSNKYLSYDGSLVRDYTHINDVVRAYIKSLELIRKTTNMYEVFNIATGKPTSDKQVVRLYEIITKTKTNAVEENKNTEYISTRMGNKSKAISLLKYDNELTIDSIIRSNKEFCSNYGQIIKEFKESEKQFLEQHKNKKEVKEDGEE